MSRALLTAWNCRQFGAGPYPERADGNANAFDRWVGTWLGRWALWTSPWRRQRLRWFAYRVLRRGRTLESMPDAELSACAERVSALTKRQGLTEAHAREIFALVREVCGRQLGMRHFAVQLMGGRAMLDGKLAEMETGEGKTLTAVLPAVAVALAGVPVHVVTVNEYLAERDAEHLRAVYAFFGLEVGVVVPEQAPPDRANAYRCDVTYGVNKDLVFDYLRDRLSAKRGQAGARRAVARLFAEHTAQPPLLRGLFFAIVDEADSIFIDEARTPLIISATIADANSETLYRTAREVASRCIANLHFRIYAVDKRVMLTPAGRQQVALECAAREGLWRVPRAREELVEQALAAENLYERDRHYIVDEGKIQIVDEFTGRVMADRSWERGLHQMIEMKEGCALTDRRETIARVTYQRFFRRYLRVAGMSGTLQEIAPELRAIYGIEVLKIPTNRRRLRRNLGTRLFARSDERWQAVVRRITELHARGQPVLVGTRSVAASESLSHALTHKQIPHRVLNARQNAEEAAIIAQAGEVGAVTIATNMAGRGTDIKLSPPALALGGLHVILTEFHESKRIDRQLYGRAARQGDVGSCESIVSLEDELFKGFGAWIAAVLRRRAIGGYALSRFEAWMLRKYAQARAETFFSKIRRQTLAEDIRLEKTLAFAGKGE